MVEGAWSMILMPDTQFYVYNFRNYGVERLMTVFRRQTEWIAQQAEKRRIKMVLHLGDVVDHNDNDQFVNARKAMSILDGVVPVAYTLGNHDYGPRGNGSNRQTFFNDHFSASDNPLVDPEKGGTLKGVYEEGKLDNSYHTFSVGDKKFLVIALQFGPPNGAVAWANQIAGQHPDHEAILITHAYTFSDDTRYNWEEKGRSQNWNPNSYGIRNDPDGVNDGEAMWQKLVSQHPNFSMTFNGHVLHDGRGFLVSGGKHGNVVNQMLFNSQHPIEPVGGSGWLRILEFMPDSQVVQVKTYSPYLDQWYTDWKNQFTMTRGAIVAG